MRHRAISCDSCQRQVLMDDGPGFVIYPGPGGGLPEGWRRLTLELGGEQPNPIEQLGRKMGEVIGKFTAGAEGADVLKDQGERISEAMAEMTRATSMRPPPPFATYEFCPDCSRQLVVEMKNHALRWGPEPGAPA